MTRPSFTLLLLTLACVAAFRRPMKRQNSYGDEPVEPAPAQSSYSSAVNSQPAAEYAPPPVDQGVNSNAYNRPAVENSGYRRFRRDNSYGDEAIVPAPAQTGYAGGDAAVASPAAEYAPVAVEQPPPAAESAAVESSGYRRFRRDNSYGDEAIQPAPTETQSNYVPSAEYAPASISQNVGASAAVEKSGYRL